MSFIRHRRATSPNKFECRNYDSHTQHFDTSAVEAVIKLVMEYNPEAIESSDRVYKTFRKIWFVNFWLVSFSCAGLFALVNPFITLWVGESYLLEERVGIKCEPIRVDDYTGKKMTFFHDPDGLPLELHE